MSNFNGVKKTVFIEKNIPIFGIAKILKMLKKEAGR